MDGFESDSQTSPDTGHEIDALKGIVRGGGTARLLAVSDSAVSIGVAHSLLQAGVSEVVPDTVADAELSRIVSRLSVPRRLSLVASEQREGELIAVSKARGGIGATTLAVNLADHLCGRKRRFGKGETRKVVLLDLDLQFGAVASFLALQPNEALYALARDQIEPDSVFLSQSVEILPSGLAVLAAPQGFMPLTALRMDQIQALIGHLRKSYDFVVVDLPHAVVDWLTPVLEQAAHVLIVTGSSVPCVQQTRRLIDFFRNQNLALRIELVMGQQKRPFLRSRRHVEAAKALESEFRFWLPPDAKHAEEAMDHGKALSQTAANCALNKEIGAISAFLVKAAAERRGHKHATAEQ